MEILCPLYGDEYWVAVGVAAEPALAPFTVNNWVLSSQLRILHFMLLAFLHGNRHVFISVLHKRKQNPAVLYISNLKND